MKAMLKAAVLGSAVAMALIGTAHAGDVTCSSTLGKQRIDGDVVVRGTCTLNGTTVSMAIKKISVKRYKPVFDKLKPSHRVMAWFFVLCGK